jgi:hypothetical protein
MRFSVLALALVLSAGCSKPSADKRLMYGSSKDIDAFFKEAHARVALAECDNIHENSEITRAFSCTAKIEPETLRLLVSKLELSQDQPDRGVGREGRCEWRPGFGSQVQGLEIWRANWTCAAKGRPFTYLEIRLTPAGEACVEVLPLACN